MQFQMKIIAALAFLLGSLCISPAALAQDAAPAESKSTDAPLQAIFMEVQGKVRWRAGEQAPWKEAAVNDLVDAGAEIRTGLKSRAALRVGKNATVLVDAGTSFQLPQIVQDGETLRHGEDRPCRLQGGQGGLLERLQGDHAADDAVGAWHGIRRQQRSAERR
jgi:hypothetical protein